MDFLTLKKAVKDKKKKNQKIDPCNCGRSPDQCVYQFLAQGFPPDFGDREEKNCQKLHENERIWEGIWGWHRGVKFLKTFGGTQPTGGGSPRPPCRENPVAPGSDLVLSFSIFGEKFLIFFLDLPYPDKVPVGTNFVM